MTTGHILQAVPTDEAVVTNIIGRAFHDLDAARWLVPDGRRREPAMRHHIGLSVEHALHHGHADMTPDRTSVATWLHLDQADVSPPAHYEALLAAGIPGARLRIIEGAGHNPQSERPEATLATVGDFLADVPDDVREAAAPMGFALEPARA